ncbi:MAG: hypothetical protein AAF651_04885 [Cyanobacteria bacterium P01_C01_bin.73]
MDNLKFLAKLLAASAAVSVGLKTVGPLLPIPATAWSNLLMVLMPPTAVAVWLGWQWSQRKNA